MKDVWKNQLSILERGKEDYATDAIIKDPEELIKKRIHVGFIKQQIEKYTNPGELVWDPFAGTGSTGIASLISNRRSYLTDVGVKELELAHYRLQRFPDYTKNNTFLELSDMFESYAENVDFVFTVPPVWDFSKGYCKVSDEANRGENLPLNEFKKWMDDVAYRIAEALKQNAYAAIYSSDLRKNKLLIPISHYMFESFAKVLTPIDIVIVDLRNDSRRKRRCVDGQENERMRHSIQHDYLFIFQKV